MYGPEKRLHDSGPAKVKTSKEGLFGFNDREFEALRVREPGSAYYSGVRYRRLATP